MRSIIAIGLVLVVCLALSEMQLLVVPGHPVLGRVAYSTSWNGPRQWSLSSNVLRYLQLEDPITDSCYMRSTVNVDRSPRVLPNR